MSVTRLVVVNADDFGLTEGVNRAIREAHAQGILTSTTVLVGRPAAAEVEDLRRTNPGIGIGLHVNLTLGGPVADPARIRSLLDDDGNLLREKALAKGLLRRTVQSAHVYREVMAQAVRLRQLGVEATHWDTHRAVAFWPLLLGPAAAAAYDAGIPCVRSPRIWVAEPGRSSTAAKMRWRLARPRRWATESNRYVGRRMLERRFGLLDWRCSPNLIESKTITTYEDRWEALFRSLPQASCEVVCHPGYVDDDLVAVTPGLTHHREVDLSVLLDPASAASLRNDGFTLGTFADARPQG